MPDVGAVQPAFGFPSKVNKKQGIFFGDWVTRAIGSLGSITSYNGLSGAFSKVSDGTAGAGGSYIKGTSSTTNGSSSELYTNDYDFRIEGSPRFNAKVRVQGTTTNMRFFVGLTDLSIGPVNYATGFNSSDGILFGFGESDTNFQVRNSNGISVTANDTGVAKTSTAWHTIEVVINNATSSYTWQLDGGALNTVTTNFPRNLYSYRLFMLDMETVDTVAKEADIAYAEIESNII